MLRGVSSGKPRWNNLFHCGESAGGACSTATLGFLA
jgi:hypothetical protein